MDGSVLSAKGFTSTGEIVSTKLLEIDTSGNSYIAGTFSGSASFGSTTLVSQANPPGAGGNIRDLFIAKLDVGGNVSWAKSFTGPDSEDFSGMSLDSTGTNIYISGNFDGSQLALGSTVLTSSSTIGNSFVAKISADTGTVSWVSRTTGDIRDLAVDSANNVYLTGGFSQGTPLNFAGLPTLTSNSYRTVYTAKLNGASGVALWSNKFTDVFSDGTEVPATSPRSDTTLAAASSAIEIDSTGKIYVAGQFVEPIKVGSQVLISNGGSDIFVATLDASSGGVNAVQTYGGTASEIFLGKAFDIDSSGYRYLAFDTASSSISFGGVTSPKTSTGLNSRELLVVKLNDQGSGVWAKRFPSLLLNPTTSSKGELLRTDGNSNVYIAGQFINSINIGGVSLSTNDQDAYVAKLSNSNGTVAWANNFGGTGQEVSTALAVDGAGKSYLAGTFRNGSSSTSIFGNTVLSGEGSFVAKIDGSNTVTGTPPIATPKSEIFWRNPNGTEVFWQLEDATKLVGAALINSPYNTPTWKLKGVADMDGDGIKDHVYQNVTTRQLGYLLLTETNGRTTGVKLTVTPTFGASFGTALSGQVATPGVGWDLVGVENVSGTSQADLIFYSRSLDRIVYWETNTTGQFVGAGFFTSSISPAGQGTGAPNSWNIEAIADFTGDGKVDVLWRNAQGVTVLWKVNGTVIDLAASKVLPTMTSSFELRGIGDFNGDGIKDVVWRDKAANITRFWTFNTSGIATQTADNNAIVGAGYQIEGIADFNGDGKSDVIWRDTISDRSVVWNFDLSGALAGPTLQGGSFLPGTNFIRNFLPGVTNNVPYVNGDTSWDIDAARGVGQ